MIIWILGDGVWMQLTERVHNNEAHDYLSYYRKWFPNDKFSIRKI